MNNDSNWSKPMIENNVTYKIPLSYNNKWMLKRLIKLRDLDLGRAISLCCLAVTCAETEGQFQANDASGLLGLAGIQWVKNLSSNVNVVINTTRDSKDHVLQCLQENSCLSKNVEVVSEDCNVLLHQRKCNFVFLEVCSSVITHFDSVMRCINHNGLICLSCTGIETIFNTCSDTAQRLFSAKLTKTEYSREMGVRVLIANMVRAAGRWNKGLSVELCSVTDQGITIVCRVLKGSKHGDKNVLNIQSLAHCQSCQNRRFVPDFKYTSSMVSGLTSCLVCKSDTNVPILLLGPMWSGNIYNSTFLMNILYEAKRLSVNIKNQNFIELLISESNCFSSSLDEKSFNAKMHQTIKVTMLNNNNRLLNTETQVLASNKNGEPNEKRQKIETKGEEKNLENKSLKPALPFEIDDNILNEFKILPAPSFFFDIQHHGIKGGNPPRINVVIEKLRMQGHRASRTHFSPRGVRTSASLDQFLKVLNSLWKETVSNQKV